MSNESNDQYPKKLTLEDYLKQCNQNEPMLEELKEWDQASNTGNEIPHRIEICPPDTMTQSIICPKCKQPGELMYRDHCYAYHQAPERTVKVISGEFNADMISCLEAAVTCIKCGRTHIDESGLMLR